MIKFFFYQSEDMPHISEYHQALIKIYLTERLV